MSATPKTTIANDPRQWNSLPVRSPAANDQIAAQEIGLRWRALQPKADDALAR